MDTNRIIINNYDLSTVSEEQQTTISTFTVVKSPRGMITPIRIPANSAAKLKDIFGSSSKNYPELFEVECLNPYYDVYVSAPYSSATIPVAVVTKDGIFPLENCVEYNKDVEDLVTGNADEDIEIPGITTFASGTYNVLKDIRYPLTNGLGGNSDIASSYPSYNGSYGADQRACMMINTGLTKKQLSDRMKNYGDKNGKIYFKLKDLPEIVDGINSANIYISNAGSDKGYVCQVDSTGKLSGTQYVGTTRTLGDVDMESAGDNDIIYLYITGLDTSTSNVDTGDIITDKYVRNSLGLEVTRAAIRTYWVQKLGANDVKATIFPKYPSTDAIIHLSFDAFNASKGYPNNTVAGRNILKLTVYDENAFHNANHSISMTGSLDELARSESGASLGFSDSNADYAEQDLICIHTISPFTEADLKGLNTSISQYPSIVLKGGTKNFETKEMNTVALHNLGWEEAKDDDFGDVAYFFDCYRNTYQSIYGSIAEEEQDEDTKSVFFDLASWRPQSGFIYNFTIAPNEISGMEPLGIGSNYWNLCNEAIINLPNGNGKITSPCTGERTRMQCLAEERRYGGAAIMYTNVNGVGGQLNLDPLRVRYKYNKDQQSALDDLNFNPMILDHTYGLMVVGNKTSKAGDVSDFSYISNTSPIFVLERELKNTVLLPQIGKENNPYYRQLRKQQTEAALRKRLEGTNSIFAQAYCDTSTADGINDARARRNRQFIIQVGIKQTVYTEYVILNLSVYDQSVDLTVVSENTISAPTE